MMVSSHQRHHFGWFTLTFLVWWPHVYTFPCRAGINHGVFVWSPTSVAIFYFIYFFGYVSISSFSPFMNGVTAATSQRDELWFWSINNYFKPRLPVICLQSQVRNNFYSALIFCVIFCVLLTPRVTLCACACVIDWMLVKARVDDSTLPSPVNFYLSVTLWL